MRFQIWILRLTTKQIALGVTGDEMSRMTLEQLVLKIYVGIIGIWMILLLTFWFLGRISLSLGWVFILGGMSFLCLNAVLNFRRIVDSKDITPETSIIAIGLGLIATPVMLSGYFYFVGVTLSILRLVKMFVFKTESRQH
jgi:hypothetical protein